MKRDSDSSIIPKIIIFLGTLSIIGIILLFFRPRNELKRKREAPQAPEKLFTQVIEAARPLLVELWEEGDKFITKQEFHCPQELHFSKKIGRSYYQCQPHFWQCYWQQGVIENSDLKLDLFGQTFHIRAKPSFSPVPEYSDEPRYYELIKTPELRIKYGYVIEVEVREIPGLSQHMLLTDSCRDVYLPQRIYGHGSGRDLKQSEGFIWDNFGRHLFIDKFYVTNQQVNEWRVLTNKKNKIISNPENWPLPALLSANEQVGYCAYFGKRVLEAKLFDAATMSPGDLKNPTPDKVLRPQTPWQRDIGKTFLGVSRVNADYQLTPLDCQLAQVKDCPEKYFTTDSATWMGIYYGIGFFPEVFINTLEPTLNLKMSSRFLASSSTWHELGIRSRWDGEQKADQPVAFRCYEEVAP